MVMRLLAYGALGHSADDYLCMAESTAIDCLYRFCRAVIAVFGKQYLKTPTTEDTSRILAVNESRGFLVWLEASTAYIDLLGRKCTKATKEVAL